MTGRERIFNVKDRCLSVSCEHSYTQLRQLENTYTKVSVSEREYNIRTNPKTCTETNVTLNIWCSVWKIYRSVFLVHWSDVSIKDMTSQVELHYTCLNLFYCHFSGCADNFRCCGLSARIVWHMSQRVNLCYREVIWQLSNFLWCLMYITNSRKEVWPLNINTANKSIQKVNELHYWGSFYHNIWAK